MNETTFQKDYSRQYDLFYQDKDYSVECDILEKIFQRNRLQKISKILDLGCGTGQHSIILADRGYEVVGVDRSLEMVERAQSKMASKADLPLSFYVADISEICLKMKFDAIIMMFAVLGYQISNYEVLLAIKKVKEHLKPGGLFIFDVWYGPAVLSIRPSDRVKVIEVPGGKIIRAASGSLDTNQNICKVDYQIWELVGERVISETVETHFMRYFFQMELAFFLEAAGLELVQLTPFDDIETSVNEKSWNVLGVARSK